MREIVEQSRAASLSLIPARSAAKSEAGDRKVLVRKL